MQTSPASSRNDIKPLDTFQPQRSRNAFRRSSVSCLLAWLLLQLWTNVPSLLESYEFPLIYSIACPQFLQFPKGLAKKFISHSSLLVMADSEVVSFSCGSQWKNNPKSQVRQFKCVKSIFISVFSQQIYLGNKPFLYMSSRNSTKPTFYLYFLFPW